MSNANQLIKALREWTGASMQRSMQAFIHYIKDQNLSMSQIGALFYINRKGSCGVSDIGEDLGISRAAASQMLDRLVQQGLVHRTEDPEDRRAKRIQLTERGHEIIHGTVEARMEWYGNLAASLTSEERKATTAALNILTEKTKELDRKTPEKKSIQNHEKERPCCD